jgi:hypothetical protein
VVKILLGANCQRETAFGRLSPFGLQCSKTDVFFDAASAKSLDDRPGSYHVARSRRPEPYFASPLKRGGYLVGLRLAQTIIRVQACGRQSEIAKRLHRLNVALSKIIEKVGDRGDLLSWHNQELQGFAMELRGDPTQNAPIAADAVSRFVPRLLTLQSNFVATMWDLPDVRTSFHLGVAAAWAKAVEDARSAERTTQVLEMATESAKEFYERACPNFEAEFTHHFTGEMVTVNELAIGDLLPSESRAGASALENQMGSRTSWSANETVPVI